MPTLTVNGTAHRVEADPATPLLYVLRNELGLHAAKFGCGLGQCGACTVTIDGEAAYSCIVPISALGGRRIRTVEGLGSAAAPGVLQQAFIDEQAAQCGYCIPGMVVSATALLQSNPHPGDDDIKTALRGNLCRCGVHLRIVRAVKRAARA